MFRSPLHRATRLISACRPAAPKPAKVQTVQSSSTAVLPESYNGAMQATHWIMGGSILGCFATVQLAQRSKGKTKGQYMLFHKSFALIALAALPARLALRFTSTLPAHVPGNSLEVFAGKAAHAGMYALMTVVPVSGAMMGYFGGKGLPFFGIFTIPGATEKNGKLAGNAFKIHKQAGQIFEYLFLAHIGAVGFHLIRGQAILARMLPFMKP